MFNVQKDLQEEAEDTHSSMTPDPSSFYEQVWKYIWKSHQFEQLMADFLPGSSM